MGMHEVRVSMNGPMKKKNSLMKILSKAKVRFEHIWSDKDPESGEEFYDIRFIITDKKFGKFMKKFDRLGDLTIE